jgi:hypothetical protein
MNLHRTQLSAVARAMVDALVTNQLVETASSSDAAQDLESVLSTYLDDERGASDRARELVQQRGLPMTEYGRLRRLVAEQRGIKVGDDALDYLLDQLVNMLLHSDHVDEVYGEDHELRRVMRAIIAEREQEAEKLEEEVRGKLKHVSEGSRMWEIEYQRMKEDLRRRRGM